MDEDLVLLIKNCVKNDRKSQQLLYKRFYGYGLGICLRYTKDHDEAVGVLNQGFLKVFTHIGRFEADRSFKSWLGRIMMNASIDNYRSNLKLSCFQDLEGIEYAIEGSLPDNNLNYNDLLNMIQQLPPAYRTVFSLFAIDGYSHEEIGAMLNINVGTSKSNLFKARQKLKQMLESTDSEVNETTYYRATGSGYEF